MSTLDAVVAKRVVADVRRLIADNDIDLTTETAWLKTLRLFYDLGLLGAAVVSAYLLFADHSMVWSWLIWAWFATDYCVRLYVANDRADYVRRHRIELLAALPLDVVRPLRLIRLLRPFAIAARATKGLRDVLGLHGFTLLALIGFAVVIGGAALFQRVEPESAATFPDALWWAVVTTTTVGYGDISPKSTEGRAVASLLMVSGIGLLGGLTGEVAQRLTRQAAAEPVLRGSGDPDVDHVITRLQGWAGMDHGERRKVAGVLAALADHDASPSVGDRGHVVEGVVT